METDEVDKFSRVWVAGMPVDLMDGKQIENLLSKNVEVGRRSVLANLNMHGLFHALTDDQMSSLLLDPATKVQIDGMPIVWLCRASGGAASPSHRQAHIDLLPNLLRCCAKNGWAVVFVGGRRSDRKANRRALLSIAPSLDVTVFDGYFDSDDDGGVSEDEVVSSISRISPALLLVGMGMPKQEQFIYRNREKLGSSLIMPVGGFLDYFAGRTSMPPRWLGRVGLEWAYRLIRSPRRLAWRYLVEPFLLLAVMLRQSLAGAKWGRSENQR